ncbi:MAG: type I-A CRISPR-associated protein Cas5a [Candidatus Bathyarchaeia archaeon]
MALTAICAKINAPIFSIKHPETFQIAASLPIPQPSSLVGALAYCFGAQQEIGLRAQEVIKETIVAARAKLIGETTTISPIILKRFRVLDKGVEEKDFEKACNALRVGDFDTFRKILEKDLTDALYREYLSPATLKCIWILKNPIESKILYLLQRLGDTESLVNVAEAWSTDCKTLDVDEIFTDYPFTLHPNTISIIQGTYTALKMCDEKRELKLFYIPCKREIRTTPNGIKYFAYISTKVNVKLKKSQKVFSVEEDYIL